jgi:L-threonylcarbamoyladenylate synthase
MTKLVPIRKPRDSILNDIARDLRRGKLVVFPTETVYGLGANAFDARAVKRIFWAKCRPADNPLIVHISEKKQLKKIVKEISPIAKKLISNFWPGPLTLLFFKTKRIPSVVTAGLPTVAVRMPSHPIAHALIQKAGVPIAAPSANTAGKPSVTRASHAFEDLFGRVSWIIDSGPATAGLESTILDTTQSPPVLLRPGAVSRERIERVIGKIVVHSVVSGTKKSGSDFVATAPGMKYRHYAPKAAVWMVAPKKLSGIAKKESGKKRIAVLTFQKVRCANCIVFRFSSVQRMAHDLFHCFRLCDEAGIKLVLVEAVSEKGIGLALSNRIRKAASKTLK